MKKIGFIGYGHMGSVLINSFLDSNAINPEEVFMYNRTKEKLYDLIVKYPEINIANSVKGLSKVAELIFICTSSYSVFDVLSKLECSENQHLVFINGGIKINTIEKVYSGKISRLIPTITSEVFTGYNIVNHNSKVEEGDKQTLEPMLNSIGGFVELTEEQFVAGSDLTSCAPAIISEIHNIYVKMISEKSGISFEIAEKMLNATLHGLIKLKDKTNETSQELIERVATKGGSTEAAVKVLRNKLPTVYNELLEMTESSNRIREDYIRAQFSKLEVKC